VTLETIEKPTDGVNGLAGLHHVKRVQKDGSVRSHFYAWRGGPRVTGDTPEELARNFEKARARYTPEWKSPRPPRLPLPRNSSQALKRACARAYDNAKARAGKRKIDFSLDPAAIVRMAEAQKWRCAVSGLPFDISYDPDGKHAYNPYGISIDRLNSSKGYTPRNIRLILTAVNFGLNDWGDEVYLRIARAVVAKDMMSQVERSPCPLMRQENSTRAPNLKR
jgi:hypothetical protein